MSVEPLFRAEAIAHRQRGTEQGGLVTLGHRWLGAGTFALLALVSVAVGAAGLIQVQPAVNGAAALAPGGTEVVMVLPVAAVNHIRGGRIVELDVGSEWIPLPRSTLVIEVVDRSTASKALGRPELHISGEELALIRAELPEFNVGPAAALSARVKLPRERLLFVLLDGFGGGDA